MRCWTVVIVVTLTIFQVINGLKLTEGDANLDIITFQEPTNIGGANSPPKPEAQCTGRF